jgi:hypothetical protein
VVKFISKRLYDSSRLFSTAILQASRKYPRRIRPVINPLLEIFNILYQPDNLMIIDLDKLEKITPN